LLSLRFYKETILTKSILLAVILAAFAGVAWGTEQDSFTPNTYTKFGWETQDGLNGASDAQTYSVTLGKQIDPNVSAELYARLKDRDVGANDTRVEAAVISSDTITGPLDGYLRLGVGQKFIHDSDNFGYWNVEPGLKLSLTDSLNLSAGIRWRDAWDYDNEWDRTYRYGATYSFTDSLSVSAGYKQKRGDSEYNSYTLSSQFRF